MTPTDFETIAKGIAEIIASVAAAFGVRQYSIATAAERRLNRSSTIEDEIKISKEFTSQMDLAFGWGGVTDGKPGFVALATQQAAIVSIARLANSYPSLKPAAYTGLQTILANQSMQILHQQVRDAMADMNQ